MTQLIKTKKPYSYYAQLLLSSGAIMLCAYAMSVSADVSKTVKTISPVPTKLTILNQQQQPKKLSVKQKSLQLEVNLPKKLFISDSEIQWQIRRGDKTIHKLQGERHALKLADGLYQVQLKIGRYSVEKQISIQEGQQVRPYFPVIVGRLQMSADYPVDWQIRGSDNIAYKVTAKRFINEIVPAGEYQVKTVSPVIASQQKINVIPDQPTSQHVTIPMGKVNLMAIRNNQPLMQAMKWEVFRLDSSKRKKVGEYHLHTKSITVPPGRYEAVARHQDKVSKRRFLVRKETTNKVILVME